VSANIIRIKWRRQAFFSEEKYKKIYLSNKISKFQDLSKYLNDNFFFCQANLFACFAAGKGKGFLMKSITVQRGH
jgi:hypothetical protein